MNRSISELAVIPITILLVGGFLLYLYTSKTDKPVSEPPVPDFGSMTNVQQKKDTFFEYMLPIVRRANDSIRKERAVIERIHKVVGAGQTLTDGQKETLSEFSRRYRVKGDPESPEVLATLLKRVDTLPASLVLAQAANESGWGTARFAKNGKNYFGLWCWSKNCGMVPTARDDGATHEVASFDTVEAGVAYYMLTLNSHPAYQLMRDIRSTVKQNRKPATGWDLAAGLLEYSERREAYVAEIRDMIEYNNLHRFTRISFDH